MKEKQTDRNCFIHYYFLQITALLNIAHKFQPNVSKCNRVFRPCIIWIYSPLWVPCSSSFLYPLQHTTGLFPSQLTQMDVYLDHVHHHHHHDEYLSKYFIRVKVTQMLYNKVNNSYIRILTSSVHCRRLLWKIFTDYPTMNPIFAHQ